MIDYIFYGFPTETDWKSWLPPILSAAAAIGSAIAAAVSVHLSRRAIDFSAKQTQLLEIHNKLSVRPYLDSLTLISSTNNSFTYQITNDGIGPAIVKDVEFFHEDVKITSPEPLTTTIELILSTGPNKTHLHYEYGHHTISIGSYISPREAIDIITIPSVRMETCRGLVNRISKNFHILISYESIYGEPFVFDSRA